MSDLIQLQPADDLNQELEKNVHPPDWVNPKPSGRYNLVVIGAGTAGLVTAVAAAGLGAKVALIERELMGGDCLNVGCVPSKGIISAARVASTVRKAESFGTTTGNISVDFGQAMKRMRRLRTQISANDSAARFRDLGVDIFFGHGEFLDPNTIAVDGKKLKFKKAVIATGARAAAPAIPGLSDVNYLTNESVFSLTDLPKRFGVIGAGPIGCELSQSFAQFGSEVFIVESSHGILPREDPDASKIVQNSMREDGVNILCCGRDGKVYKSEEGIHLTTTSHERKYDQVVDQLLVSVGRAPNVDGIGLEAAGVEFDKRTGVKVDDNLRTTNKNVFAAGDICSPYKFTHAADFMARIVIQNALFMGRAKVSRLVIPWATYTTPEIAHVGLYGHEAENQGIEIDTFIQKFDEVDRAILESEEEGFVKIHVRKGSDTIVGGTVVASNAGDMISEISLAMTHGLGLKKIGSTIHPYPTQAEAIRKLGDQYNRTRLTPKVTSLMARWLKWTR